MNDETTMALGRLVSTSESWDGVERCAAAARKIRDHGYSISFVVYGEDARTPGLLGQIRGVTDRGLREVKIAIAPHQTMDELADTLEHELHHVEDPEWDCGNRDVLGRGGPRA